MDDSTIRTVLCKAVTLTLLTSTLSLTHELPRCNLRNAFVIEDVFGMWVTLSYNCDRNEVIPTRKVLYLTMLSVAKFM
jgi:hypothetical protein